MNFNRELTAQELLSTLTWEQAGLTECKLLPAELPVTQLSQTISIFTPKTKHRAIVSVGCSRPIRYN